MSYSKLSIDNESTYEKMSSRERGNTSPSGSKRILENHKTDTNFAIHEKNTC